METHSEVSSLKARIRATYFLWVISLLSLLAFVYFYRTGNPGAATRSDAQTRAEIANYRVQVDVLSADLLRNQRDLRNAQRDLRQLATDYKNAVDEIKRLQARP